MAKIQPLGNINAYDASPATFKGKAFSFDGTTKGLTLSALAVGAKAGDTVDASFGLHLWKRFTITATPWDKRANGHWANDTGQFWHD